MHDGSLPQVDGPPSFEVRSGIWIEITEGMNELVEEVSFVGPFYSNTTALDWMRDRRIDRGSARIVTIRRPW